MRGQTCARWLIVALAIGLLAAGCGKKNNKSNANGNTAIKRSATPTPTVSAQDLLDAAQRTLQADTSFHFTLTHENGSTPIADNISMRRADGDILKPDKLKANVDGALANGQAVSVKVINVGQQVWINLVGNRYVPLPNAVGASQIVDPNSGVTKVISGAKNPQIAGQATINGVQTTEVDGTIDAGDLTAIDSQAQAGKPVKARVWIGDTDHQVYRIRLEGPLNDQEPANIARQIDLSNFNETLDIQPPS